LTQKYAGITLTLYLLQASEERGYDEACYWTAMVIAEGPGTNYFLKGMVFYTPLKREHFTGYNRATVLELAKQLNIEVKQASICRRNTYQ